VLGPTSSTATARTSAASTAPTTITVVVESTPPPSSSGRRAPVTCRIPGYGPGMARRFRRSHLWVSECHTVCQGPPSPLCARSASTGPARTSPGRSPR
jgi:hypothetical protein